MLAEKRMFEADSKWGAGDRVFKFCFCLALLCWTTLAFSADPPKKCEICQNPFGKSIYSIEDPVRQVKKFICLDCSKSRTVCSACGLAANPKTLRRLSDGRILCDLDAKGAVLDDEEAQRMFRTTKRDVQQILSHWTPLPDTNITVYLVNRDDFNKEFYRTPSLGDPQKLLGLTRSSSEDGTNYEHRIYLLSGVLRPQFTATCAHEYTHTWLAEHSDKARTLNKDTEEGICELISAKYIRSLGDTNELNRILENGYTRGQIHALIAAESRYQFHRIVDWIHLGVDSWLDKDKLERLLELKAPPESTGEPEPLWRQAALTAVPEKLTLKGISGSAKRRFALINNSTLEQGEETKVRVGDSNLVVRCVEIRQNSVLVRVAGEKNPVELFLTPGKKN